MLVISNRLRAHLILKLLVQLLPELYSIGLKCTAHQGHIFFKLTADQVLVFDWIAGSCQVNLLKTGLLALIVIVQPCMMKRRRRQVKLLSVLHKT